MLLYRPRALTGPRDAGQERSIGFADTLAALTAAADKMNNIDNMVRRLRARVLQSAQRERSLDWTSANALEKLRAQNVQLQKERDQLKRERTERIKVAKTQAETTDVEDGAPQDKPIAREEPPSMRRALGLKEAADLLAVSYSTVYMHRKALGFFQIGNQWRIWPETLREMTERGAATESPTASKPTRSSAAAKPVSLDDLPYSVRAAAAAKELDELLARPIKKRTSKR